MTACVLVAIAVAAATLCLAHSSAEEGGSIFLQQPQGQSEQAQGDPSEEYAKVIDLVNRADKTVVPLSKVISKALTDEVAARIEKILGRQESATALLDEANARLQTIAPELTGESAQMASVLSDSIAARKEMLAYGCIVLRASSGAYGATDSIVGIWQQYLDGHAELQKASDTVSLGTTKAVKKALRHDKKALSHFRKASKLVEKVQKTAPNADLSVERDYASLQSKAATAAVASDKALLQEDSEAAEKNNAEYGKLAARAAKAAKRLPATTDDLVKSVYYSFGTEKVSVEDAQNRYEAAAKRAAKDDKELAASNGTATSKES